eukprot:Hpha_TRINITY_DN16364_c3_g7::TRINITY_DN16364_c3_g7_i1::g.61124::m.61124/K14768/UTP7, WDR46; U3 small nucleolar RNA-associated protein 7
MGRPERPHPEDPETVGGSKKQVQSHDRKVRREQAEVQQKYSRKDPLASFDAKRRGGRLGGVLNRAERAARLAAKEAAQAELVYGENSKGFLEADEGENQWEIRQEDIREHLDVQTLEKTFDLKLPKLGPYTIDYSHNGNALCLGGEKGHCAVVNWKSKRLFGEEQLKDKIRDVCFLHDDSMFASAQRKYVYIYNHKGEELHCLDKIQNIHRLQFLRNHFLLSAVGKTGTLHYFDVSTGKYVVFKRTKMGPCEVMRQNPWNGVIALGHNRGQVSMWSPTCTSPLVKMLCHKTPIVDLDFTRDGKYMVTAGTDSKLLVWDTRMFKEVRGLDAHDPITSLSISQTGLLAAGKHREVLVYKDWHYAQGVSLSRPYLKHWMGGTGQVSRVAFCPYEDVLGIGHANGFSSVVVPGAGEANYDYFVANPYESAKRRKERPVHQLLDKLPADLITLDAATIGRVDSREQRRRKELVDRQLRHFQWNQSMTGVNEADVGSEEEREKEAEERIVRPEPKRRKGKKSKKLKEKKLYLQKQEHSHWKARGAAKRRRADGEGGEAGEVEEGPKRRRTVMVSSEGTSADALAGFFESKTREVAAKKVARR